MPKSADAIVVGLATINGGETATVGVGADLDKKYESAYGRGVMAMATALGASADSVTVLPALEGSRLVVVGLEDADVTPERLRRATGNALRSIAAMEGADGWEVVVSLEVTDPELVQATAEGALLGAYRVEKVTGEAQPQAVTDVTLVASSVTGLQKDALASAQANAAAVCQARDWGNTPPNLLYPESFAEAARGYVKDAKISVEILDEKGLEKGGYGGILAVGGGSTRSPASCGSATRRAALRATWRWSARASPSTRAASTSSLRARWRA